MTAQEIIDRLKAEGITIEQFVHMERKPEWMGLIKRVDHEHNRETEEELENAQSVYRLTDHNIYLMANGTKENGVWDYWGLRECEPHTRTIIEYR